MVSHPCAGGTKAEASLIMLVVALAARSEIKNSEPQLSRMALNDLLRAEFWCEMLGIIRAEPTCGRTLKAR